MELRRATSFDSSFDRSSDDIRIVFGSSPLVRQNAMLDLRQALIREGPDNDLRPIPGGRRATLDLSRVMYETRAIQAALSTTTMVSGNRRHSVGDVPIIVSRSTSDYFALLL